MMRAQKWGRIVNIVSSSVEQPISGLIVSNAFRPALAGWAKTLAAEVASDGILVNCVEPGRILTSRTQVLDQAASEKTGKPIDAIRAERVAAVPLKRYGTPEEFGAAVAFLASEQGFVPDRLSSARRWRRSGRSMKLLTFEYQGRKHAGVLTTEGVAPIEEINAKHGTRIPDDLLAIIRAGVDGITAAGVPALPLHEVTPRLPYDVPPKIWCIGLNYLSHAEDINAVQPEEPGSFMKPASCMFQPGGDIVLPPPEISNDVDAEGELGVVIGKKCRFVPAADVPGVIFGYTTTLDLTALDVLRKNPRYLTRAKSIDTFFSFGPVIVTADEIPDVESLEVITEHNGGICSRDFVRHMRTRPFELVRFHSDHMTLDPGDLISTGCPKGARIKPGDRVGGRIEGVGTISANVTQGRRS